MSLRKVVTKALDPRLLSVAGAGLGQVLMLLSVALISRVYNAHQISEYGMFFVLFNISQIVIMFRLEQALVYANDEKQLFESLIACFIAIPVSILSFTLPAALFIANNPILQANWMSLTTALVLCAASAGAAKAVQFTIAWHTLRYKLALLNFLRPASISLCLALSTITAGDSVLSWSLTVSQFMYLVATLMVCRKHWKPLALSLAAIKKNN